MKYTIGITTFELRFDQLKILINSIRKYSEVPIIVIVNGNFGEPCSEDYRAQSLEFFSKIKNIFPVYFTELRGFAKMVNTIFVNSNTEVNLIMNDDIIVKDGIFFDDLKLAIENLDKLCCLKSSWFVSFSHFLATKKFIREIGFFDERFLGFGEEDGDITFRFIKKYDKCVPYWAVRGLEHTQSEVRQDIKPGVGKYSLFNREFVNKKYLIGEGTISGMFGQPSTEILENIPQYPYEEFFESNKHTLI